MLLTNVNEMRLTYLGRVAYADLYFSTPDLAVRGALTDRGKIILRYGEPPTIATFAPATSMTDDGESLAMVTHLWWYPESGLKFVFVGPPAMNSVRFAGDFDLDTIPAADRFFSECVRGSRSALVLDLSRIGFMDARVISFLVRERARTEADGRSLSLRFPSRAVTRVLELGIVPDFEVEPSLARPANERRRLEVVSILEQAVERAIAIDGAQRGSAQIVEPESGALRLIAAPGFSRAFRSFFDNVHDEVGASCGVAASDQRVVAVPDVTASPIFMGTPSLDVMLDDAARSCISIPIVVDGMLVGMVSTHHDEPHRWRVEDVRALQSLAASIGPELAPGVAA